MQIYILLFIIIDKVRLSSTSVIIIDKKLRLLSSNCLKIYFLLYYEYIFCAIVKAHTYFLFLLTLIWTVYVL